jgi:hypothetical protein
MATTFKNLNLFASGPHKVAREAGGVLLIPTWRLAGAGAGAGMTSLGVLETAVRVRGVVVASTRQGVLDQLEAIESQVGAAAGVLDDHAGQQWANMVMVGAERIGWEKTGEAHAGGSTGGCVMRGRMWSCGYECRFIAFDPK